MLNEDSIPDYLKHARLVLLSKNGKSCASLNDIRPIAVLSQLSKVLEKAIKNKLEERESGLFNSGNYQTGFKKGVSTSTNLAQVLNDILRTRSKRTQRKIIMAIDITKAYDNVNRRKLFNFLDQRVKTDIKRQVVNLIKSLYTGQLVKIGDNSFTPTKGI